MRHVPDMYAPTVFDGSKADAETWLAQFRRYVDCHQMPEEEQLVFFHKLVRFVGDYRQRDNRLTAERVLETYFCHTPLDHLFDVESVFSRMQRPSVKVRDYVAPMQKLVRRMPDLADKFLQQTILRGLLLQIKAYVLQRLDEIKSVNDIIGVAKIAETAGIGLFGTTSTTSDLMAVLEELKASHQEVRHLTSRMDRITTNAISDNNRPSSLRRVTFENERSITSSPT